MSESVCHTKRVERSTEVVELGLDERCQSEVAASQRTDCCAVKYITSRLMNGAQHNQTMLLRLFVHISVGDTLFRVRLEPVHPFRPAIKRKTKQVVTLRERERGGGHGEREYLVARAAVINAGDQTVKIQNYKCNKDLPNLVSTAINLSLIHI